VLGWWGSWARLLGGGLGGRVRGRGRGRVSRGGVVALGPIREGGEELGCGERGTASWAEEELG
jgi:hypothetical protein